MRGLTNKVGQNCTISKLKGTGNKFNFSARHVIVTVLITIHVNIDNETIMLHLITLHRQTDVDFKSEVYDRTSSRPSRTVS